MPRRSHPISDARLIHTEGVKPEKERQAAATRWPARRIRRGKLEASTSLRPDDGVGIYDLPDNVTAASLSIA